MRDTDSVLGNNGFGTQQAIHGDQEIERIRLELLKTKLELDQTRTAYKHSREEASKLKKLLQEINLQNAKRQGSVVGAHKEVAETTQVHQPINNQTYTCRCKVFEQEVISLHSVLELRMAELQDLRRQCTVAEEDAKQLPTVLKANSALKLQTECLEAQLEKKSANEQILIQEKKSLLSSVQHESAQNRRLSFCNEELQWKLRLNTSSEYRSSPLQKPVAQSTPRLQRDRNYQPHLQELEHSKARLVPSTKENLLLQSTQVYGVVEKEASISWIIEMEQQKKEDSSSTCPVQQTVKFNKKTSTKSPKSLPDQLKKPKTSLTPLQKKKLLR